MDKRESVYRASLLLVKHFKDCLERDGRGFHSRVFSYFLHPEVEFVGAGQSREVKDGAPPHPEHVVPCAVLFKEACRLIKQGMPEVEIAHLISKHWKVAYISKDQASRLDSKTGLNLKQDMPEGWSFETGDTYERLKIAGIELLPFGDAEQPSV